MAAEAVGQHLIFVTFVCTQSLWSHRRGVGYRQRRSNGQLSEEMSSNALDERPGHSKSLVVCISKERSVLCEESLSQIHTLDRAMRRAFRLTSACHKSTLKTVA